MHLSLNSAKLVALLLNTLYGILQYSESDEAAASVDLVFGLRVIQGETSRLLDHLTTRDAPKTLREHLSIISERAGEVADNMTTRARHESPLQFEKLRRLLSEPFALYQRVAERRMDPHLVWTARTMFSSNLTDEMSNRCLLELFPSSGDCRPSPDCLSAMLETKNVANYALSRQLIYFTVATRNKLCNKALLSYYSMNKSALTVHLNELCSNVIHETDLFLSRAPSDLHRLTPLQKDLLMQHVFVCGQHGFVDMILPRLLWMTVGQQDESGCYPLPASDAPPEIGRRLLAVAPRSIVGCSAHSTAVASGATVVFLNYLLSSDAWTDFHLADGAFATPHQSIADNRFEKVDYRSWTRDRLEDYVPLGDPPPFGHNISADLIALLSIFFGIVILLAVLHNYCGRSPKQLYAYSYKKL